MKATGTAALDLGFNLLIDLISGTAGSRTAIDETSKALLKAVEGDDGRKFLDVNCIILKVLIRCPIDEETSENIVSLYEKTCDIWWTGEWKMAMVCQH
jgi:hypothetical protein